MSSDHESLPSNDKIAEAMREALARVVEHEPASPIEWNTVMSRARRVVVVRRAVAAACVVVVLSAAAVGFASASHTRRRGITVVETPTTFTTRPAVCVHPPIAHVVNSYYGLTAPGGTSIDFRTSQLQKPGDGDGNTVDADGAALVKHGPGVTIGLISHEPAGAVVYRGFGDFDGDGRSDLLVDTLPEYTTYVVPGTLTSGTYDPAVVGFLVPHPRDRGFPDVGAFAAAVGDQNDDGAADISVGTSLYSGRQVTANHGRSTLLRPFRMLSASYAGLLQIDSEGAPPSFVVPDSNYETVEVLDRRSDRLALDGVTADQKGVLAQAYGTATGWLVNGRRIVDYGYSTRGGATTWRFDLDAACAQ